jgi:hypothetical protein
MSEKIIQLKCPKCQCEFNVHEPALLADSNQLISQVLLVPTYGAEERECPGCGIVYAPSIVNPQIAWLPTEKIIQKESRIIPATGPLPIDFRSKVKK